MGGKKKERAGGNSPSARIRSKHQKTFNLIPGGARGEKKEKISGVFILYSKVRNQKGGEPRGGERRGVHPLPSPSSSNAKKSGKIQSLCHGGERRGGVKKRGMGTHSLTFKKGKTSNSQLIHSSGSKKREIRRGRKGFMTGQESVDYLRPVVFKDEGKEKGKNPAQREKKRCDTLPPRKSTRTSTPCCCGRSRVKGLGEHL